jgi:hypothetical protein
MRKAESLLLTTTKSFWDRMSHVSHMTKLTLAAYLLVNLKSDPQQRQLSWLEMSTPGASPMKMNFILSPHLWLTLSPLFPSPSLSPYPSVPLWPTPLQHSQNPFGFPKLPALSTPNPRLL